MIPFLTGTLGAGGSRRLGVLLVVATLVIVGGVSNCLLSWCHMRDAIAEIYAAGAVTGVDNDLLEGPRSITFRPLGRTSSLTDTGLKGLMADLKMMKRLKYVSLAGTAIGDESLHHLAELQTVETLILANTRVTDAGLMELQSMRRLRRLDLSCTLVSDHGLMTISDIMQLKEVYVGGTAVTSEGIRRARARRVDLKISDDVAHLSWLVEEHCFSLGKPTTK